MNNKSLKSAVYPWLICIFSTVLLFSSLGIISNSFSVFNPYLREINGLTETQLSLLTTARSFAGIIASTCLSFFLEKFEVKKSLLIGVTTAALSMVILSVVKSYPMMLFASFFAGVGYTVGGSFYTGVLINRWFIKSKGLALSITLSGTGFAATVMPPIVVSIIEKYGMQRAFLFCGIFIAVLGYGSSLILKDKPEDAGLKPYGFGEDVNVKQTVYAEKSITKSMSRSLLAGWGLLQVGSYVATQYYTLHFTNIGFTTEQAALVLSVCGLALTIGKFIYGFIVDRIGVYRMNYISFTGIILGVSLTVLGFTKSYPLVMAAGIITGVSCPFTTIGTTLWASEMYSEKDYAKAFQNMHLMSNASILLFSIIPGIIADHTHEYTSTYIMFAVMDIIGAILVQSVFIKKRKMESKG